MMKKLVLSSVSSSFIRLSSKGRMNAAASSYQELKFSSNIVNGKANMKQETTSHNPAAPAASRSASRAKNPAEQARQGNPNAGSALARSKQMGKFHELRKLDVSKHVEKKNGLNYLSWAWAVDQLLQNDPAATWDYREPSRFGDTLMVFCSVTAFGKTMTAQLPVMDHRNRAVVNPDAFQVNVAMQRCLAKAIALHGIGLYIYAGEDLPEKDEEAMLSAHQVEVVRQAADQVGLSVNDICKVGKVATLAEIPVKRLDSLLNWINSQKRAA